VDRTRDRARAATRARVLVVDDDESLRRGLEKLLAAEGFSVSTAPDGEAALAEARRALPDVVLTDLHMPRMDGVELCTRLHEIDEDLPVILMTGHADLQSVIESLRERAEDFLTKPLEYEAVLWRVERAMARRTSKLEQAEVRRTLRERLVERAEGEALQRAQLNALLENLSEGVVVADPTGRVVMMNDAARAILDCGEQVFTVRELSSLEAADLDGLPLSDEQRPLSRALRGESFAGYEVVLVRPNGDRRRVLSTGTSVRERQGSVALAIVLFRDITEQRHLEQQRADYLGFISHDLRNPLGVVQLSLSLLSEPTDTLDGPASRAFRVRVAQRAERNAKRMGAMIEQITESTTLESQGVALRRVTCDLRSVVANVVDSMDDSRARRITVETDGAPLYAVLADASRLERIVANLVTNALKYSAEGAPVGIRLARAGSDVVLEVTDHGIGIPPESVERLFERYYRAPGGTAHASGLGLGLYIARLFAEAHGGRIEVSSEVGKGSTFRLLLSSLAEA
jgi:PAS domain S-box-containing protein